MTMNPAKHVVLFGGYPVSKGSQAQADEADRLQMAQSQHAAPARVSRRLLTQAEAEDIARKLHPYADPATLAAQIEQLKAKPFAIDADDQDGQGIIAQRIQKHRPLLDRLHAGEEQDSQ